MVAQLEVPRLQAQAKKYTMPRMTNATTAEFWNKKYEAEKDIWGERPVSIIAECEAAFREAGAKSVLVMAAGYGRNAKYFADKGYSVEAVEISEEAIRIGRKFAPEVRFIKGDALSVDPGKQYDAVFCFDIMQILLANERKALAESCARLCRSAGIVMLSCLSTADALFGQGRKVEERAFEGSYGLHFHYADEDYMRGISGALALERLGHFRETYDGGVTKDRIYGLYRKA